MGNAKCLHYLLRIWSTTSLERSMWRDLPLHLSCISKFWSVRVLVLQWLWQFVDVSFTFTTKLCFAAHSWVQRRCIVCSNTTCNYKLDNLTGNWDWNSVSVIRWISWWKDMRLQIDILLICYIFGIHNEFLGATQSGVESMYMSFSSGYRNFIPDSPSQQWSSSIINICLS